MTDVLISGAGPAGAIAAMVLARAGARVCLIDRAEFPREKLCGDTLNPGALARLRALDLDGGPIAAGLALEGMIVTGPGVRVDAGYGPGVVGRAVTRHALDAWLVERAVAAGVAFEPGWTSRRAIVDDSRSGPVVRGLVCTRGAASIEKRAAITIAADGSRSGIARSLGLARTPARPRRWAFGFYAEGVPDVGPRGEMHIRPRGYVGIAPITATLTNVCVVTSLPADRSPEALVGRMLAADASLRERTAGMRRVTPIRVLGPLAVEAPTPGMPGLLLAGDAAGFVDPMTGDGLSLAIRGAELAAAEAVAALVDGALDAAVWRLAAARRAVLGPKIRFNRALRALVESPAALAMATAGARLAPAVLRHVIRRAGDAA